jgi:hypothetical protein
MIDVHSERILSLSEAAALPYLMRNGKPRPLPSMLNWVRLGVDGHRLETIKIAGRICTSVEAIDRWLAALNAPGYEQQRSCGDRSRRGDSRNPGAPCAPLRGREAREEQPAGA